MNQLFEVSVALPADVPQLVALINSAYRGEAAKKGWTHEADLIEGAIRTDETSLLKIFTGTNETVLKCTDSKNEIVGSVYLEKRNEQLYLGMLSVAPQLQGGGIGKLLLKEAEKNALEFQCNSIIMQVIPQRTELIAWYNRHGYSATGETEPFPADNLFGTPRQPIHFVILKKKLSNKKPV